MGDGIPYTHWAYFTDEQAAGACAAELARRFDALVGVEPTEQPTAESDEETRAMLVAGGTDPQAIEQILDPNRPPIPPWLLRAARTVDDLPTAHAEVRAVVERHGGTYDGGESGWFDLNTGKFL